MLWYLIILYKYKQKIKLVTFLQVLLEEMHVLILSNIWLNFKYKKKIHFKVKMKKFHKMNQAMNFKMLAIDN